MSSKFLSTAFMPRLGSLEYFNGLSKPIRVGPTPLTNWLTTTQLKSFTENYYEAGDDLRVCFGSLRKELISREDISKEDFREMCHLFDVCFAWMRKYRKITWLLEDPKFVESEELSKTFPIFESGWLSFKRSMNQAAEEYFQSMTALVKSTQGEGQSQSDEPESTAHQVIAITNVTRFVEQHFDDDRNLDELISLLRNMVESLFFAWNEFLNSYAAPFSSILKVYCSYIIARDWTVKTKEIDEDTVAIDLHFCDVVNLPSDAGDDESSPSQGLPVLGEGLRDVTPVSPRSPKSSDLNTSDKYAEVMVYCKQKQNKLLENHAQTTRNPDYWKNIFEQEESTLLALSTLNLQDQSSKQLSVIIPSPQ